MKLLVKSILLCFILASFAPQDRNLFQREAIMIQLFKHLVKPNDFKPFPNYNDSLQWINLDDTLRYRLINEGEKALEKRWEILTATEYRTFRTHGNVINFQIQLVI